MNITINDIYIVQSHLEDYIVAEKIEAEDYNIYYALLEDDGEMVPVLVDGHHRLAAALKAGVEPIIYQADHELPWNTVEEFVAACGERDNPETINGITLW